MARLVIQLWLLDLPGSTQASERSDAFEEDAQVTWRCQCGGVAPSSAFEVRSTKRFAKKGMEEALSSLWKASVDDVTSSVTAAK